MCWFVYKSWFYTFSKIISNSLEIFPCDAHWFHLIELGRLHFQRSVPHNTPSLVEYFVEARNHFGGSYFFNFILLLFILSTTFAFYIIFLILYLACLQPESLQAEIIDQLILCLIICDLWKLIVYNFYSLLAER